jgi:hypothetical protein
VWVQNLVPIFFYAWHVLKAWHLHSMEKIKHSDVRHVVLYCLHVVMFMSINLDEIVNDFKAHGKELMMESFDNL